MHYANTNAMSYVPRSVMIWQRLWLDGNAEHRKKKREKRIYPEVVLPFKAYKILENFSYAFLICCF